MERGNGCLSACFGAYACGAGNHRFLVCGRGSGDLGRLPRRPSGGHCLGLGGCRAEGGIFVLSLCRSRLSPQGSCDPFVRCFGGRAGGSTRGGEVGGGVLQSGSASVVHSERWRGLAPLFAGRGKGLGVVSFLKESRLAGLRPSELLLPPYVGLRGQAHHRGHP